MEAARGERAQPGLTSDSLWPIAGLSPLRWIAHEAPRFPARRYSRASLLCMAARRILRGIKSYLKRVTPDAV